MRSRDRDEEAEISVDGVNERYEEKGEEKEVALACPLPERLAVPGKVRCGIEAAFDDQPQPPRRLR